MMHPLHTMLVDVLFCTPVFIAFDAIFKHVFHVDSFFRDLFRQLLSFCCRGSTGKITS